MENLNNGLEQNKIDKVDSDTMEAIQVTRRKIDSLLLRTLFIAMFLLSSILFIPNGFQLYAFYSDTDNWFSVYRFFVYHDSKDDALRFVIDKEVNSSISLNMLTHYIVIEDSTKEVLCEKGSYSYWEKSGIIDSNIRFITRGCYEESLWKGKSLHIKARFVAQLHFGVTKDQTVTTNSFVYNR